MDPLQEKLYCSTDRQRHYQGHSVTLASEADGNSNLMPLQSSSVTMNFA